MKRLCVALVFIGVVCVRALAAAPPTRPADLPEHYRDFKIYATSAPDPADPAHIVVTIKMLNEGKKPLDVHVGLEPNERAGLTADRFDAVLAPQTAAEWEVGLHPADGFQGEVLTGEIAFGNARARELYIALRGPDPADFESEDVPKITARAEVIAAYAPSVRCDWWPTHPSAGVHPSQRKPPLLTIAAGGQSHYAIVIPQLPAGADGQYLSLDAWSRQPNLPPGHEELIRAVRDLQRCIQLISGATLPVSGARVLDRHSIALHLAPPDEEWPHPDAYRLHTTEEGDVVIEGQHIDGLRQGIYGLLSDHLGCRWFLPGELGEEIPQPADRTAVIGQMDERRRPSFFSVSGMSWGASREWDCRNRSFINRGRMNFGHSWQGYLSPSEQAYQEHPDWWARDREGNIRKFEKVWSHTNFCTTNPEVIEIVAQKANAALSNPDALVASLDPNDAAPMCLCERCLELDRSYGVENPDGRFVTDRLLHFSKVIYDRLDEKNKAKYLGILVYGHQTQLPKKARPHEHHTALICDMTWHYDHTRPFNDPTSPANVEFYRLLKGWGEILTMFGFYDYYGHFCWFGPWGIVHKMREDLPAFRDLGGTYLMIEAQPNFAAQGLNLYVAGRLAWDVDADVDVLLEEFFAKFYGPVAEPMRDYWLAIEKAYALERPGPESNERVPATPAVWVELDGHLKQAEALAANLPEEQKRFRDRVAFHRAGFELSLRQVRIEYLLAVLAGELKPWEPAPPPPDPAEVLKLVEETQAWFADTRGKYSGPYWPPLLANYCWGELDETLRKLRAEADKRIERAQPLVH